MAKFFRILIWLTLAGVVGYYFLFVYEPADYQHPLHRTAPAGDGERVGHPFGGQ